MEEYPYIIVRAAAASALTGVLLTAGYLSDQKFIKGMGSLAALFGLGYAGAKGTQAIRYAMDYHNHYRKREYHGFDVIGEKFCDIVKAIGAVVIPMGITSFAYYRLKSRQH